MTAARGHITGRRVRLSQFHSDGHTGRGTTTGGHLITHGTTGVTRGFIRRSSMSMHHSMATDTDMAYTITDFMARAMAATGMADTAGTRMEATVVILMAPPEEVPPE